MFRAAHVAPLIVISILVLAGPVLAADIAAGLNLGSRSGPGVELAGSTVGLTAPLPVEMRLGLGLHACEAGDPYAARRVFINNNTNGTPEKSALLRIVRLDFLAPCGRIGPAPLHLFGGPRHACYRANFNYVGGNENLARIIHAGA